MSRTGQDKLVRILPTEVEFDPKDKTGRRVVSERGWDTDKFGRFFPATLTTKQLHDVIAKTKLKLPNLTLKEEAGTIVYQYKGRPLILLNLKEGQFYAPATEVDAYGEAAVKHQAHIVVDMLRQAGLSNASRGKTTMAANSRQLLSHLKTYNKTP